MYNECFSHMSKTLQKDISFSHKVQLVQAKMNSHLNMPVYSLISLLNIKYENQINNNCCVLHTHISNRKRQWTTFQLVVA